MAQAKPQARTDSNTPRPDAHTRGEWPFPAAAQARDKNENLDESKLTRGERVTDTSTHPDGGNPKGVRGTFELTGDRGHDAAASGSAEQE